MFYFKNFFNNYKKFSDLFKEPELKECNKFSEYNKEYTNTKPRQGEQFATSNIAIIKSVTQHSNSQLFLLHQFILNNTNEQIPIPNYKLLIQQNTANVIIINNLGFCYG
jgi:hypothetical protein